MCCFRIWFIWCCVEFELYDSVGVIWWSCCKFFLLLGLEFDYDVDDNDCFFIDDVLVIVVMVI